jgi:hypothetical protein
MAMTHIKHRKKMGRPRKPVDQKLSESITVWVSRPERAALEAEADRLGLSLSVLLMRPWREAKGKDEA